MDKKVNYPNMILEKSKGLSASEHYLIQKCKNIFLSLWSYPNPFRSNIKGKELCDVLAVFQNHIFIFSDKNCEFASNIDIRLAWNRWFRHTIYEGAKQILKAEQWLRSGREIFLDPKRQKPFPLDVTIDENTHIHRIVVARGAQNACLNYFGGVSGSLRINTTISGERHLFPIDRSGKPMEIENDPIFTVGIVRDRVRFVHVLDDDTLECIMNELDTVSDFVDYLEEKERIIAADKHIIAPGEEDILACYLSTIENEKHCCVKSKDFEQNEAFSFPEQWRRYILSEGYAIKKESDRISYLWDDLLERTFASLMAGTSRNVSHEDYQSQSVLFTHFAKPNRICRRALAQCFLESFQIANAEIGIDNKAVRSFVRCIRLDDYPDTLLTVLWLQKPSEIPLTPFLQIREEILRAKILTRISEIPEIVHHIGIAKTLDISQEDSEDFVYVRAADFPPDCEEVQQANELLTTEASLTKRYAKSRSIKEYERGVDQQEIPFQ